MSKMTLKAPPRQRAAKPAEFEEIKEIIEKFRRRGALNVFTAVPLEDLAITEKTPALIDLINADVLRRIDPKTNSLWENKPIGEETPLRQQFFFLDSQIADKWLVRTSRIQLLFWLALIAFIIIISLLILMAL